MLLTADSPPSSTKRRPPRCPSVPAFLQTLNNLSAILDKAEAYARKIDREVLLNCRLAPVCELSTEVTADAAEAIKTHMAPVLNELKGY